VAMLPEFLDYRIPDPSGGVLGTNTSAFPTRQHRHQRSDHVVSDDRSTAGAVGATASTSTEDSEMDEDSSGHDSSLRRCASILNDDIDPAPYTL